MQMTHIYNPLVTGCTYRSLNQLSDCLCDVSLWMNNSKLKLNAYKSVFLITGTPTQYRTFDGFFRRIYLVKVLNVGVTFE